MSTAVKPKLRGLKFDRRKTGDTEAMMVPPLEPINTFKWKDLHKRKMQIFVVEPNPECLEFFGHVFGRDMECGKVFVIAEYRIDDPKAELP